MMTDPETGKPMSFVEVVAAILVEEHNRTPEAATELVNAFPDVVVRGIIRNDYRATAIALLLAESKIADSDQELQRDTIGPLS